MSIVTATRLGAIDSYCSGFCAHPLRLRGLGTEGERYRDRADGVNAKNESPQALREERLEGLPTKNLNGRFMTWIFHQVRAIAQVSP
jgi:hypothetical protein